MKYIFSVIAINIFSWVYFPRDDWEYSSLLLLINIALLSTACLQLSKNLELLPRSIIALVMLSAWSDIIVFSLYHFADIEIGLDILVGGIFSIWLMFAVHREYFTESEKINPDNVNLLVLNPRGNFEVIKALFGFPIASVCIYANGYVWSFRKASGKFEKTPFNRLSLENHFAIDTGITPSVEILRELNSVVGKSRFPGIQCVYAIRHVLNKLGGKYAIKSKLEYLAPFYILRVRGE